MPIWRTAPQIKPRSIKMKDSLTNFQIFFISLHTFFSASEVFSITHCLLLLPSPENSSKAAVQCWFSPSVKANKAQKSRSCSWTLLGLKFKWTYVFSREVYVVQISSSFGAVKSLIVKKKKKVYLSMLGTWVPLIQYRAYLKNLF